MGEIKNKKYGFFMCLCLIIGTIIGVGIFFKNENIYGLTGGNGILGIISWIIGGIIILFLGLSFIEITSISTNSNEGIALYAKLFGGKIFGKIVRNTMNHIYIPLTFVTIAYYTTKATIWIFGDKQEIEIILLKFLGNNINYQIFLLLFNILYIILILFINTFYKNIGKWIQIITVILKLLPLFLIGIVGLFFFNSNNINIFSTFGLGDPNKWKLAKNRNYLELILITMPNILFSFEGFLSIIYLQKNIKNSKRNIPITLIIGLIIVTFIYLLVSISTLNLDISGNISLAVKKIFKNNNLNKIIKPIIYIFILISAFGTLNGYSLILLNLTNLAIKDEFIFNKQILYKIFKNVNINYLTFIISLIISLIWNLVIIIPSLFVSQEVNFYDFISNSGGIMAFILYSLIIFFGIINRFTKKIKTKKNNYFIYTALLSIISIFLILSYNIYLYFELIISLKKNKEIILQTIFLLIILLSPLTGLLINNQKK